MNDVDHKFIARMRDELEINSIRKGDFNDWDPSYKDLVSEIDHHLFKLKLAILDRRTKGNDNIKEKAADLGNYCMKMFQIADQLNDIL